MEPRSVSHRKFLLFSMMIGCLGLFCGVLFYVGFTAIKTAEAYRSMKTSQRGWKGSVHAADAELGFAPIPNAEGAHVFPLGPDVPMRYDGDGFRVPVGGEAASHGKPLFLALGCSFTYGDAAYAEDTYPYLVGKLAGGSSQNAGVCSYGLAQMLILARKLVPIHRPDYLLVQYSPWLVDRAQMPFAPSRFGRFPVPFFYEKGGNFALNPPAFMPKVLELPASRYRDTPPGWLDAISFYWNVGLPLSLHDDFNMLRYSLLTRAGRIQSPTSSRDDLTRYVYAEIDSVAKRFGAKVVVVVLGSADAPVVEINETLFPPDALVVHGDDALLRRLPVLDSKHYLEAYGHWRGNPPTVVDSHPNGTAHKIIAEAVISAIKAGNRQ